MARFYKPAVDLIPGGTVTPPGDDGIMNDCGPCVDSLGRSIDVALTEVPAPEPGELTEEQTRAMLEEQTQRIYGLSLVDFIAKAEANELDPHPDLVHLVLLSGARTASC